MDVDVEELKVKCNHVTLLRLKKFKVDAKVLNETPMIDILMDTFSATYIHKDIFKWASTNFKLPKNMQVCENDAAKFFCKIIIKKKHFSNLDCHRADLRNPCRGGL